MTSHILTADQQKLVEDNMRLVPFILNKYFGESVADDEDFVSLGYIALCKAAAAYNPSYQTRFSTLAARSVINIISNYNKVYHAPKRWNGMAVASLNYMIPSDDDHEEEYINQVPDTRIDVETEAINNVLCDKIRHICPTFVELDARGITVRDFARKNRLSRQSVHFKMNREFRKARSILERQSIKSLMEHSNAQAY